MYVLPARVPGFFCGDFNMIYRAANKNNGRLHCGDMRRF